MNKRRITRALAIFLVAALAVGGIGALPDQQTHAAAPANSNYEKVWTEDPPAGAYTKKLGSVQATTLTLDMWHYSGGYWQVGNKGADKITINDDKFKKEDVAQMVANTAAEFTGALPAEVTAELAGGNKVIAQIKSAKSGVALDAMFKTDSLQFRIVGSELYFSAFPKFNFIDTKIFNFKDFVTNPAPNEIIPFVNPTHGYNIYSIFGNGLNAKQASGWLQLEVVEGEQRPADILKTPSGRIHPSMVKDTSGALKSGYKVFVDGALHDSAGLSIGQRTFNNAGACGLHFEYPVEFIFYSAPAELPGCTVCGDDLIEGSEETACSPSSCKDWGKAACGCTVIEDPVTIPAGTSGCSDVIKWSETKAHTYKHSPGCKTNQKTGNKYCPGHTCTHVYTYQATMTADAVLNPTTFKSGYGFTVNATSALSSKQISDSGSCGKSQTKTNDKKPTLPNKGEVRVGWTVKMKMKNKTTQTQPKNIALSHLGNGKFEAAPNKVSESKEKKIYVDVAVAGTKQKPVKHNVVIVISGGGVPGVAEFCKTITKQITINGDMYEDDYVH